jgi:hypothetical protein
LERPAGGHVLTFSFKEWGGFLSKSGKGDALWSRMGGMPTLDRQRLRDGTCADATT